MDFILSAWQCPHQESGEVHQRYSQLRPLHHLLKVLSSKEEPVLEFLWSSFTIIEEPELIQQEEEPLDTRDGTTVTVRGIMEELKLQSSFGPAQTRIRVPWSSSGLRPCPGSKRPPEARRPTVPLFKHLIYN